MHKMCEGGYYYRAVFSSSQNLGVHSSRRQPCRRDAPQTTQPEGRTESCGVQFLMAVSNSGKLRAANRLLVAVFVWFRAMDIIVCVVLY